MAAASTVQSLKDEATCSLCREFYKDPVTTECGHNFCRSCITEQRKVAGSLACCPECDAICALRGPRPNMKLLRMTELVRQLSLHPETPRGQPLCEEHQEQQNMEEQARPLPVRPERPRGQHLSGEQQDMEEQARPLPVRPERPSGRPLCQDLLKLQNMEEQARPLPVEPETPREQPLCQEHLELHNMEEQARQRPLQPGRPRGEHLCEQHLELLKGPRKADLKLSCPLCRILHSAHTLKPRTEADTDHKHPTARGLQRQIEEGQPPPVPRRVYPPPSSGPAATANSSAGPSEPCKATDELRIILVGTSGAGKSAIGNSILGRREFVSKGSAVPVTRAFQRGEVEWGGRRLLVVDTPGILPSTVTDEEVSAEMEWCAQLSSLNPHALLLVLQAGRFTLEERESVQRIQRLFGKEALKFTVIVFTRKEDLEGETILNFVRKSEQRLRELVNSCGWRVCAFNNHARDAEREQQVRELIQVIDTMLKGNGAGVKAWWKIRQLQGGIRRFK